MAEILGGAGGGLSPSTFQSGGAWPPTLERRQLYKWVGDSQYSVENVALCEVVNFLAAAISIYTKIIYKLYTHEWNN